jgi:hypothetical protein
VEKQCLTNSTLVTLPIRLLSTAPFRSGILRKEISRVSLANATERTGNSNTSCKAGDAIAILYGGSVPVILRPTENSSGDHLGHRFVGEAYIYGKIDDEAFGVHCQEETFKLL